jgi:UDP-2,3-diacylglucosamine pyrophosphatase LpxH
LRWVEHLKQGGVDYVSGKLKIVVSDFHLGAGPLDIGENPLEDFIADEAFAHFLEALRAESNRDNKEVELIINGDFFEFLQVPAVDEFDPRRMYPPEAYNDSSQAASIKRLDLIATGHPIVFEALADFIQVETPRRRMTLIKGNHDVNLFWPGVKQRLREVLGATGQRASMLLFAERYVSREGIYVEHGHQYAERLSRWDNFDDPRDQNNHDQLFYPLGSRLVIDFFNSVERDRAWADSLKPLTALAWYSLQWDFPFAAQMLLMLAKHIPANVVSAENKTNNSLDTLCRQLGDAAACQDLSYRYHACLDFRRDFHMRIGQLLVPAASPPGMFVWPMPPADESGMEIARTEIEEIQASMRRVAVRVAASEGAHVIVFGHTHRPCIESLEDGTTLVNCGSWQWLGGYDPTEVDVWRGLLVGDTPTRPHHRLTYARIDYDEQDIPHAQLLNFAEERDRDSRSEQVALGRMLSWLRQVLGNTRSQ